MKSGDKVVTYSVSDITRRVRSLLEGNFGDIWVEGEVSNVRRPASGHLYFTLKDEGAQIAAVMFRGNQIGLKFQMRDGIQMRVYGGISVYEKGGNYQIIVRKAEEGGKGALHERFEALKKKLEAEGLFSQDLKKPIPLLPRRVGVVTSRTGAAIRDILNVLGRRFENIHVVLVPVKVQGDGAAEEIAAGIDLLNERGGVDVMIVGRGGGSIEDLWCFNEEVVARAIFRSSIPVVSAVGHEIDFTISDFVADLRAPTPSAAAELVVEKKEAVTDRLADNSRRMIRALKEMELIYRSRLTAASKSYVFREPMHIARQYMQRLDGIMSAMARLAENAVSKIGERLVSGNARAGHAVTLALSDTKHRVDSAKRQLALLNPLDVLGRGYSITRDASGKAIKTASSLKQGDCIVTLFAKGTANSRVVKISDINKESHGGSDGKKE